jgi:hypothetical protein
LDDFLIGLALVRLPLRVLTTVLRLTVFQFVGAGEMIALELQVQYGQKRQSGEADKDDLKKVLMVS